MEFQLNMGSMGWGGYGEIGLGRQTGGEEVKA